MVKTKNLSRNKLLFVTSLLSLLVGGSHVAAPTSLTVINTRKNATDAGDTQGNAETIELNMATGDEGESRYTCSECGEVDETLKEQYLNQDAADAVMALINEIGNVDGSNASKEKIGAAREAYNKLTPAQKELINNYQKLTEAEDTYAELVEPTYPNKDVEKGMPGGLIALIVILSIIFLAILALIVLFILDRKNILVLPVLHQLFAEIPFFKNKKEEAKKLVIISKVSNENGYLNPFGSNDRFLSVTGMSFIKSVLELTTGIYRQV